MKKTVIFLLMVAFSFSGCEKDDICDADTPTTPRLVISFFDSNTPELAKKVTDLKVIGDGMEDGIIFNENAIGEAKFRTSGTSISIPLKTIEDSCSYTFILNDGSTNATLTNQDKIEVFYTRNNVYVSRACGFKTIFQLDTQKPFLRTDGANADGFWMKSVRLENPNIEFENETHIKVYF
ncbi:DUF6452 family protein [Flavobacterium sp. TMP13]|uniref:DUF6452 family protein n=1 Tax=Flavobacterium sp. TMP13 TaxID=3425950 RepID=UPI003D77DC13